jgi:uncharacterized membrane protein YfcA
LAAIPHAPLLFLAALISGALNSVAGGGSFISFPALLFSGVPPINANATNTVAVWPGTLASVGAYRREFAAARHYIVPLALTSTVGGLAGALLLLHTPQRTFLRLVPWLLLGATLLFTFGNRLTSRLRAHHHQGRHGWGARVAIVSLQLTLGLYIGYFGAGAGILALALLAIMGMENIHTMNGIKALMTGCANGVAVVTFIAARTIWWPQGVVMLIGAIIGGYGGAWYALRVNPRLVRAFVIVIGFGMTAYFFWRYA